MARNESDIPSIDTPLAHEAPTETEHALETGQLDNERVIAGERELRSEI